MHGQKYYEVYGQCTGVFICIVTIDPETAEAIQCPDALLNASGQNCYMPSGYSVRSAMTGSFFAASLAGMMPAISVSSTEIATRIAA